MPKQKKEDKSSNNSKKKGKKGGKQKSLSEETMKNSIYKIINTVVTKLAALALTIILARLLLPELYGLYNLVLSIVLIFGTLINRGTNKTVVKYVSEHLGSENRKKARSYFRYLLKLRFFILGLVLVVLAASAKFLAEDIFNKPAIFLPLLAGCLLVLMNSFRGIFSAVFASLKDFRTITINSVIFHSLRVLLPLIAILLLADRFVLIGVFAALALAAFISGIVEYFFLRKNKDIVFGNVEEVDKERIRSFLFYMLITVVSLRIFGSVDTLMLGNFVSAEYLGYYRAALNLILSVSGIFGFATVLLPVFSRISGERLERGFQKAFKYITMFSVPAAFGLFVIARYFILAIYGNEYLPASLPLYVLSLMVIIMPLAALYSSIFQAKEKARALSRFVIYALVLNIILNYVLIKYFPIVFSKGPEFAILGAGIATFLSRGFHLSLLLGKMIKMFDIKPELKNLLKFVFSAIIMAGFLLLFTSKLDMNLFLGFVCIFLGIVIYLILIYLLDGLQKEDIGLIREIFYRKLIRIKKTKRI